MSDKIFKVSKRVWLKKNTDKVANKDFIPKDVPFEDNKSSVEQVCISINQKTPVLLIGETGTGKTSMIRHLAFNTDNAFVRVNHHGGTDVSDILGKFLIDEKGTKWVDGLLIEAMKNGYWYLADEINAASAEINFAYHSLLDDDAQVVLVEKGNEVVRPHPNFRFFGAMNPPTDYAGAKELNKALLSRFQVVMVDYAPPKVEQKIIADRTGIEEGVAEKMVKFASEIRVNKSKGLYQFTLSTRDLIMWANNFKYFGEKFIPSAQTSILNKVNADDLDGISTTMGLHFKTIDNPPKQTVGTTDASATVGGGAGGNGSDGMPF